MRKKLPARRVRALRWTAALCLLVLGNYALGLYCVTPDQALRQAERRYGVAPTEICIRVDTPQADGERLRHWLLSCNGGDLLLSTVSFDLGRGWVSRPVTLLRDTASPISVGLGAYCNETEGGYETTYLFFGSVRDGGITGVEAAARHSSMGEVDGQYGLEAFPEERVWVPSSAFVTAGGRQVFLAVLDPVFDPGGSTYPEYAARGVRANGSTVEVPKIATDIRR